MFGAGALPPQPLDPEGKIDAADGGPYLLLLALSSSPSARGHSYRRESSGGKDRKISAQAVLAFTSNRLHTILFGLSGE